MILPLGQPKIPCKYVPGIFVRNLRLIGSNTPSQITPPKKTHAHNLWGTSRSLRQMKVFFRIPYWKYNNPRGFPASGQGTTPKVYCYKYSFQPGSKAFFGCQNFPESPPSEFPFLNITNNGYKSDPTCWRVCRKHSWLGYLFFKFSCRGPYRRLGVGDLGMPQGVQNIQKFACFNCQSNSFIQIQALFGWAVLSDELQ